MSNIRCVEDIERLQWATFVDLGVLCRVFR